MPKPTALENKQDSHKYLNRLPDDSSEGKDFAGKKENEEKKGEGEVSQSDVEELDNDYPPKKILYNDKLNSKSDIANQKGDKLSNHAKRLNWRLGTGDGISAFNDGGFWKSVYDYIMLHWDELCIDGKLAIELHTRYILCTYIILFIPAQGGVVIPSFYHIFIPKQAYEVPFLSDGLYGLKNFLKFVTIESSNSFIITFYFGRANTGRQDLEFLLRIPDLIYSDPMAILREFFKFEIRAKNYDPNYRYY